MVEDHLHHPLHVVGPAGSGGHDGVQLLAPALDGVVAGDHWRLLGVRRGEVGEVTADDVEALSVVLDLEVGAARDLAVDLAPPHLLGCDVLAHRRLDQVRAAQRHRRRALHHGHEVGEGGDVGGAGGAGTEHGRHHRHDARHDDLLTEQVAGLGEGRPRGRPHARAGRVEQPHHGDLLIEGHLAHALHLALSRGAHGTAQDGEVVGRHRHGATVDAPHPGDDAVGGRLAALRGQPVVHVLGQLAELDEAGPVEQQVEAFPHVELALAVLTLDPLLAAHGDGPLPARHQVLHRRFPVEQLRVVHRHFPFHTGSRFSAKAARPSAASSDKVTMVSCDWR